MHHNNNDDEKKVKLKMIRQDEKQIEFHMNNFPPSFPLGSKVLKTFFTGCKIKIITSQNNPLKGK